MNVVAAFSQEQGCRDAGKAGADYTDVGVLFAEEWRIIRVIIYGGCVIRAGMRFGLHAASISSAVDRVATSDTEPESVRRIS